MSKKLNIRKIKDILLNIITYLSSSLGLIIVLAIFIYVFINGCGSLTWNLLAGDYHIESYTLSYSIELTDTYQYEASPDEYYSSKWGVSFIDSKNTEGNSIVKINYIHPASPFNSMVNSDGTVYSVKAGETIETAVLMGKNSSGEDIYIMPLSKNGAKKMASAFDLGYKIQSMNVITDGGGIRGSIISTLYLILFTLLFVLPIGIGGAIYLGVYAPKNKITDILRTMIDMISGIPSIIFGLVGALIFIPFFNSVSGSSGGSILSGALTMAVMLLPIVIKNTEEAILNIPRSFSDASLALGASQTQTTFKIILPNAIPGILTATLLAIGRIIGESAALIFAIGTAIQDKIIPNQASATLAIHIWSLMSGEKPNYATSSAIAIVILFIVLILNVLVKLIGKKLNRFGVK